MGRKHLRTGKQVFLCIAGLTFVILFSGCAAFKELTTKHNARKSLIYSKRMLAEGDYHGSLKENQRIQSLFVKGPPGDEALFNIGLIYSHYTNPDRNYQKALIYFNSLIKRYPKSPLVLEAKIWVSVLESTEYKKTKKEPVKAAEKETKKEIKKEKIQVKNNTQTKVNEHLKQSRKLLALGNYKDALQENRKILKLPAKSPFKDEALFNIALIYSHYNNPEKDYKESIKYFTELINDFPQSPLVEQTKIWLDVLNVIEKAKQVDIEIEQKKKELIE